MFASIHLLAESCTSHSPKQGYILKKESGVSIPELRNLYFNYWGGSMSVECQYHPENKWGGSISRNR